MSTSATPDDVASTFIATDDATGEAADTGTPGGSSTATSTASKGVQKVCDVCEEWYAIIPASVSSVDCLMYKQMKNPMNFKKKLTAMTCNPYIIVAWCVYTWFIVVCVQVSTALYA